ncbi:hypothetical protein [Ottowia testudinis]|uniref:Uncharacterized protein n=1 Tax=Ottowia testudinis TaxID=2816950 RepID=A0A975CHJ6_9BURK|nr:hypothetical protein [Ottowia testudinis]QTD45037.1 hypothetical protein J1M35_18705 [Ottowia testudinis]
MLANRKQGFILVLNRFCVLLTAPVGLGQLGVVTRALTIPVMKNLELKGYRRQFIFKKYTEATGEI